MSKELTSSENKVSSLMKKVSNLKDENSKLRDKLDEAAFTTTAQKRGGKASKMSEKEKAELDILKMKEKARIREEAAEKDEERKRLRNECH